jgi:hypothetical protein
MGRRFDGLTKERRDELLSAYLDDQLDAEDRARLEAQLAVDPALRTELEALRRTVALVRDLPPQPIPRNFILPRAIATKARPAPVTRRPRWLAPFLTAATAAISLLFVAVLAGDLLFSGVGGMAQLAAPAPEEDRAAVAPSPVGGTIVAEEETEKALSVTEPPAGAEAEGTPAPDAESPATPIPAPVVPPETPSEVKEGGDDEERYLEVTPEAGESPVPPTGGGESLMESPVPTPTPAAGGVADVAAPTGTPVAEMTAPASLPASATAEPTGQPLLDTEPAPPGEVESEPPSAETGERDGRWSAFPAEGASWRIVEIALGATALLLALAAVWAWRARRR